MTWWGRGREANGVIVDPDFLDHWRTRMLVDLLDGDELAPLYVLRLWAHCQNRKETQWKPMPNPGVKALCKYAGDAEKLVESLATAGWIERFDGDGILVVKWGDHNSQLVAAWENGRKGGRPRKNPTVTHGIPMGNPTLTQAKPIREEKRREEKKEEPPLPPKGDERANGDDEAIVTNLYTDAFRLWYSLYPRRLGKQAAARAFQRAMKRIAKELGGTKQEAFDWLCERTSHYGRTPAGAAGTFTPYPATWLNQGHYDDDPKEWERPRETSTNERKQPKPTAGQQHDPSATVAW
jgi:hypothetical protein